MSRIFPVPTRETIMGPVRVVLDMEGYPNLKSLDPYSINEKITSAIKNEGYRGRVSIWAYADKDAVSDELDDDYGEAGIFICLKPAGDESSRLNMMLVDMLFWAMTVDSIRVKGNPSNLLILSKNKKMEQDPNFSRFRKALEKKGFNVTFALPDTLINLDGGNQSVSEKKCCKCCPSTA